ncbi:MAG: outer membrane beta-barrel protein [Bryobacteraceae bacterium]|jgi:TolA-binding protein
MPSTNTTTKLIVTLALPMCLAWTTIAAYAQVGASVVRGVTLRPDGAPLPEAQVLIHNQTDNSDQSVVSGPDGAFVAANLKPGRYTLIASKEGFLTSSAALQLKAHESASVALALSARAMVAATAPVQPVAAPAEAQTKTLEAMQERIERLEAMQKRIEQLEAELNQVKSQAAAPATKQTAQELPLYASLGTPSLGSLATRPAPPAPPLIAGIPPAGPASENTGAPVTTPGPAASPAQDTPATPQAPPAAPAVDNVTPFADYDWTWLNGNPRNKDVAFDSKFFTPEIRADITYTFDFNRPSDDSMGGSSELFRSNEIQLEQLGLGGDFHWDNVRARFMTQFGAYSTATIRNDPSYAKGQWDLADADRYLSEAYGGYHLNVMHGINIDAGIFMSYVGLFSYYNFDNWAYQPSYVSSNTPWFFQGIRIQTFPTHHLKIEPWIINGWQSYASANSRKGLGGQIKWTPFPWMNILSNNYGLGHDDLYIPNRGRIHTDNSIEIKYYDKPGKTLDKMALSFTGDLGCEFGGGVSCHNDSHGNPKQSFVGFMIYDRYWFDKDLFGFTLGGGVINNPGRYLVLLPPINGETAASAAINSPYFTENPGDPFKAWDCSGTFDYMPKQWLTFRFEGDFRHANVPYWSGSGGITPPASGGLFPGTNNGYPTEYACMNGSPSVTAAGCATQGGLWSPDLRKREWLLDIDLMVKF